MALRRNSLIIPNPNSNKYDKIGIVYCKKAHILKKTIDNGTQILKIWASLMAWLIFNFIVHLRICNKIDVKLLAVLFLLLYIKRILEVEIKL